jgi:hypothetical protein
LDKDVITKDSLQEFPFAKYAAKHLADHVLLEDVSRNVEDGMKQLFDPSKSNLAVCIWVNNPDISWIRDRQSEGLLSPRNSPLHYATLCQWGLHSIVEFFVIEHLQDVNSRDFAGFYDRATPLHLASDVGHEKVACFLIKCDANVTAQDGSRSTPLPYASRTGGRKIAGLLLEHGADVAAQDRSGDTPLHLASRGGHMEVLSMLIERGADVTAQSCYGETPLHLAARNFSSWDWTAG